MAWATSMRGGFQQNSDRVRFSGQVPGHCTRTGGHAEETRLLCVTLCSATSISPPLPLLQVSTQPAAPPKPPICIGAPQPAQLTFQPVLRGGGLLCTEGHSFSISAPSLEVPAAHLPPQLGQPKMSPRQLRPQWKTTGLHKGTAHPLLQGKLKTTLRLFSKDIFFPLYSFYTAKQQLLIYWRNYYTI